MRMNRKAKIFVKFAMHTYRYMFACKIEGPLFLSYGGTLSTDMEKLYESCMENIRNQVPHAIELAEFYETVTSPAAIQKLQNRIRKAALQGGWEDTRNRLGWIDRDASDACRDWQRIPDTDRVASLAMILREGDWQSNIERAAHLDAMAMKFSTSSSQIFPRPIPQ